MDWTYRLRLRNVKMLLSLAQPPNIRHSALALNTTQPGLSKWLKDLEEDIGLPLFERHARRLDAQMERASSDMAALREGAGGVAASDTVPLAITRLLAQMPKVRVSLVEGTNDRLVG